MSLAVRGDCYLIRQNIGVQIDDLRSEIFVELGTLVVLPLLNINLFNSRISCDYWRDLSQPLERGSILLGATQYELLHLAMSLLNS